MLGNYEKIIIFSFTFLKKKTAYKLWFKSYNLQLFSIGVHEKKNFKLS